LGSAPESDAPPSTRGVAIDIDLNPRIPSPQSKATSQTLLQLVVRSPPLDDDPARVPLPSIIGPKSTEFGRSTGFVSTIGHGRQREQPAFAAKNAPRPSGARSKSIAMGVNNLEKGVHPIEKAARARASNENATVGAFLSS
jgi:hypothetical protein